jgi:hypothetical protein
LNNILDFRFLFDESKSKNDSILFELWDEDATLKADKDDLVGLKNNKNVSINI